MKSLYSILYVSRASDHFRPDPGIEEIVRWSVEWNRSVGVTGTLIYSAGRFSQYLEGPQEKVEALFASIRADPRHGDVMPVQAVSRQRRLFPRWSLAYAGDASFIRNELVRLHSVARQGEELGRLPSRMVQIMYQLIRMRAELEPAVH